MDPDTVISKTLEGSVFLIFSAYICEQTFFNEVKQIIVKSVE
jgi:hypothetical protein